MKLIIALLAVASLAGCATTNDVAMAKAHYEAQAKAKEDNDRPLIRITAQPGESITFSGVQSFEVHAPSQDKGVPQYVQQHHPAWGVVGKAVDAAGIIGTIHYSGRAAIGLTNAVGKAVGDVAQNPTIVHADVVQAPAPEVVIVPPEVIQIPAPEIIQLPPPEVILVPGI